MQQITQADLKLALKAWEIAREKTLLINQSWALFLKRQQEVIQLMRENGWSYGQAAMDVEDVPAVSHDVLQSAWKELDDRRCDYMKLEAEFTKQQMEP